MALLNPIADRSVRSVFVGNIPYEATEEQLKDIFCEVGPVVSFRLVYDRETGKPKGYGFCEYKDQETALSAMRNLNGHELNGRPLRVDNAASEKSKEELKNLQASLGGPPIESPYGNECDPVQAPEAISKAVASLPPEQMFELMKQMKLCVQNNPNEARNMLLQNPQLAYALLQAQVVMKIVDPQVAMAILQRANPNPAPAPPTMQQQPKEVPQNNMSGPGFGNHQASPQTDFSGTIKPGPDGKQLSGRDLDMRTENRGMLPHHDPDRDHIPHDIRDPRMAPQEHRMGMDVDMRAFDNRPRDPRDQPMDQRMPPMDPRLDHRGPTNMDPRAPPMMHGGSMDGPSRPVDPRVPMGNQNQMGNNPMGDSRDPRMDSRDPRTMHDPRQMDRPYDPRTGPRPPFGGDQGPFDGFGRGNMHPPDIRDPRVNPANMAQGGQGRGGMMPMRPVMPPQQQPAQGSVSPAMNAPNPPARPAGAAPVSQQDQEKAALIMQVLQLSDQQIAMLPPEQRQSILVLKEQIARAQ